MDLHLTVCFEDFIVLCYISVKNHYKLLAGVVCPSGITNLLFMNLDTCSCPVSSAFSRLCSVSDDAVTPVAKLTRPVWASEILNESMKTSSKSCTILETLSLYFALLATLSK